MKVVGLTQEAIDKRDAEADRQEEIATLESYLSSTDWYAVRMAETSKPIPDEVNTRRQAVRDRISELRVLIG